MSELPEQRSSKPLPCPFCGGTDIVVGEGSSFRWRVAHCACGAIGPDVRIQTMGSGTQAEWEAAAEADAIEAWNTRAAPPPSDVQRDAERYRWLRNFSHTDMCVVVTDTFKRDTMLFEKDLDDAIDAARASETKAPRRLSASEERSFTETFRRSPRRVADETGECQHEWRNSVSHPGTRVCDLCGARRRTTLSET